MTPPRPEPCEAPSASRAVILPQSVIRRSQAGQPLQGLGRDQGSARLIELHVHDPSVGPHDVRVCVALILRLPLTFVHEVAVVVDARSVAHHAVLDKAGHGGASRDRER